MVRLKSQEDGVTIVELLISLVVFAVVALSFLGLFVTLVRSTIVAKRRAIASSLATNQLEYLKSLPYDNLAISGGSIIASSYQPATLTKVVNGVTYTVHEAISYADDAFDGCANYPNITLKQTYCRNYPPPSGAPATDTNPADYKLISVYVGDKPTNNLASVTTQISARVTETASTTGALFVSVLDETGNPVSGANVNVVNATLTPNVNVNDSTDATGNAIFYGLPPDSANFNYAITASLSGYSTLNTILPSGALQPTYQSQKIFTQASSYVTLVIKKQGQYSLLIETTDVSGSDLGSVKFALKGGYKKYSLTTDTSYYYDTFSPSDNRATTDNNGELGIQNLVPGDFFACGDTGSTGCTIGGTTYYLVAAVPYGGATSLEPITVPIYDPANPPVTTFGFNGNNYLQKVRLMLTTQSTYPRITTITPDEVSLAAGVTNTNLTITGANLPCSAVAASCSTTVKVLQGASTYTASCTGAAAGLTLNCTINLTGVTAGMTQLQITANSKTLTLPGSPLRGGINVAP